MALSITSLTEGIDTTNNPASTASVNPTSGSLTLAFIAYAVAGGGSTTSSDTVVPSGARGTWTLLGHVNATDFVNVGRRGMVLYAGTGSVASEAITITATTGSGTWTETAWSIIECTGQDGTTPYDTAQGAGDTSATSGEITTSLGTAGAGDEVIAGWFHETGESVDTTTDGSWGTLLGSGITGGSDIRTLHVFYDASDPQNVTPAAGWSTASTWGAIGVIINVAAGGGGDPEGGLVGGKLVGGGLLMRGVLKG